jgi:hypothetical protein
VPFVIKSKNAENSGAVAAIIDDNVANQGPLSTRISFNIGESILDVFIGLETVHPFIARLNGTTKLVTTTVKIDSLFEDVVSENIIARTVYSYFGCCRIRY